MAGDASSTYRYLFVCMTTGTTTTAAMTNITTTANLGIPRLLEVQDFCSNQIDAKSVMTYVAEFFKQQQQMQKEKEDASVSSSRPLEKSSDIIIIASSLI